MFLFITFLTHCVNVATNAVFDKILAGVSSHVKEKYTSIATCYDNKTMLRVGFEADRMDAEKFGSFLKDIVRSMTCKPEQSNSGTPSMQQAIEEVKEECQSNTSAASKKKKGKGNKGASAVETVCKVDPALLELIAAPESSHVVRILAISLDFDVLRQKNAESMVNKDLNPKDCLKIEETIKNAVESNKAKASKEEEKLKQAINLETVADYVAQFLEINYDSWAGYKTRVENEGVTLSFDSFIVDSEDNLENCAEQIRAGSKIVDLLKTASGEPLKDKVNLVLALVDTCFNMSKHYIIESIEKAKDMKRGTLFHNVIVDFRYINIKDLWHIIRDYPLNSVCAIEDEQNIYKVSMQHLAIDDFKKTSIKISGSITTESIICYQDLIYYDKPVTIESFRATKKTVHGFEFKEVMGEAVSKMEVDNDEGAVGGECSSQGNIPEPLNDPSAQCVDSLAVDMDDLSIPEKTLPDVVEGGVSKIEVKFFLLGRMEITCTAFLKPAQFLKIDDSNLTEVKPHCYMTLEFRYENQPLATYPYLVLNIVQGKNDEKDEAIHTYTFYGALYDKDEKECTGEIKYLTDEEINKNDKTNFYHNLIVKIHKIIATKPMCQTSHHEKSTMLRMVPVSGIRYASLNCKNEDYTKFSNDLATQIVAHIKQIVKEGISAPSIERFVMESEGKSIADPVSYKDLADIVYQTSKKNKKVISTLHTCAFDIKKQKFTLCFFYHKSLSNAKGFFTRETIENILKKFKDLYLDALNEDFNNCLVMVSKKIGEAPGQEGPESVEVSQEPVTQIADDVSTTNYKLLKFYFLIQSMTALKDYLNTLVIKSINSNIEYEELRKHYDFIFKELIVAKSADYEFDCDITRMIDLNWGIIRNIIDGFTKQCEEGKDLLEVKVSLIRRGGENDGIGLSILRKTLHKVLDY